MLKPWVPWVLRPNGPTLEGRGERPGAGTHTTGGAAERHQAGGRGRGFREFGDISGSFNQNYHGSGPCQVLLASDMWFFLFRGGGGLQRFHVEIPGFVLSFRGRNGSNHVVPGWGCPLA